MPIKSGVSIRALAGLLALIAVVTSGCGTDPDHVTAEDDAASSDGPSAPTAAATTAPSAVPWEKIETYLAARRGIYRKFDNVDAEGDRIALTHETVRFDLDVPYHDRSIQIPASSLLTDEPPTGSGIIRFVTTDTVTLMRNAAAMETCGTQWVDMTAALEDYTSEFGMVATDARSVEPFEVLRLIVGEPEPVRVAADGTLYEISVPSGAGLSLSGSARTDPDILGTFSGMQSVGQVWLPADGGTFQVHVDYTDAVAAVTEKQFPDGATYTSMWFITTDIPEFDTALPPGVADSSCMEQGPEG